MISPRTLTSRLAAAIVMVMFPAAPAMADRPAFAAVRSLLTEQCIDCHNATTSEGGFNLERFDASGVWNDTPFQGPGEFKNALRKRDREFVRGFVEYLLSYALGRRIEHFDMPSVTKIVDDAEADGYRICTIIEGVVLSYPFRQTRNVQGE